MDATKSIPSRKFRNWNVFVTTSPRLLQPGRVPSSRCIAMSDRRSAIDSVLPAWHHRRKLSSPFPGAMFLGLLAVILSSGLPWNLGAQTATQSGLTFDVSRGVAGATDNYWRRFALGFGASIMAHENAHILSAIAMGFHPHVGLDRGRPTLFSGIDSRKYPHKQFIFSAAGLTTQAAINEAILDIPHTGGGPMERGILAGGIAITRDESSRRTELRTDNYAPHSPRPFSCTPPPAPVGPVQPHFELPAASLSAYIRYMKSKDPGLFGAAFDKKSRQLPVIGEQKD